VIHRPTWLVSAGEPVSFPNVANRAGIGRAILHRRPERNAVVHEHQLRAREAFTLTGLAIQIDQLRVALEAVASRVRRHEEELRQLRRTRRTGGQNKESA
jgi:hypothetical protein